MYTTLFSRPLFTQHPDNQLLARPQATSLTKLLSVDHCLGFAMAFSRLRFVDEDVLACLLETLEQKVSDISFAYDTRSFYQELEGQLVQTVQRADWINLADWVAIYQSIQTCHGQGIVWQASNALIHKQTYAPINRLQSQQRDLMMHRTSHPLAKGKAGQPLTPFLEMLEQGCHKTLVAKVEQIVCAERMWSELTADSEHQTVYWLYNRQSGHMLVLLYLPEKDTVYVVDGICVTRVSNTEGLKVLIQTLGEAAVLGGVGITTAGRLQKGVNMPSNILIPFLWGANRKKKKTRICPTCKKTFSYPSDLKRHMCTHTGEKPLQCTECDKGFIYPTDLKRHIQTHHEEKPFQCDMCDKSFSHNSNLTKHKFTHSEEKPYKCTECGQVFTYPSDLTRHKLTHSGERPYKCTECGKGFIYPNDLTRHIRTHTGEKPFQCDMCDKSFAHNSNLTKHKLTHSGEKTYQCDMCDKSYYCQGDLEKHKRTHTGEKPFQCDMCDKSYYQSNDLTRHKLTHSGENLYQCDVCDKSFIYPNDLTRHIRTHTGEKPFQCDMCEKSYCKRGDLKKHKDTKHGLGQPQAAAAIVANVSEFEHQANCPARHSAAVCICQKPKAREGDDEVLPNAKKARKEPKAFSVSPVKPEPMEPDEYAFSNTAQFELDVSDELKPYFKRPDSSSSYAHSQMPYQILHQWLWRTDYSVTLKPQYQGDIESLMEPFEISETDSRLALRGQQGIKAKKRIEAETIVGIYVGRIRSSSVEMEESEEYGSSARYLFDLQFKEQNFVVDANYFYRKNGNWTALFNANKTYKKGVPALAANCEARILIYKGFPLIVFFAKERIEKGQELLIDYGKNYWKSISEALGGPNNPIVIG